MTWFSKEDINELNFKLDRILRYLRIITIGEIQQMHNLDEVLAAVAEQTTVVESTKTLLEQLKAMLDAAGTDPAKINAVFDALAANTDALKAAVVANTPV